jgi:hypothetical protein
MRLDRKELLDEIGFVWTVRGPATNDKVWHQQHKKLVEFKRKSGHCRVPYEHEQDESLGMWVSRQRNVHVNDKMRPDRKTILDELDFFREADSLAARSSTTNARGLVIGSFHAFDRPCF